MFGWNIGSKIFKILWIIIPILFFLLILGFTINKPMEGKESIKGLPDPTLKYNIDQK